MSVELPQRNNESNADQQRFLRLFLRSEREIFRYVATLVPNLADADDIVQQTALALWEKFSEYDPDKPFTAWACRFALNKTRQWVERHQKWQHLLNNGLAEELAHRREAIQPELESKLINLEKCLKRLPQNHLNIIEGYYFQRKSVSELASVSGRSEVNRYKYLQRIRHALFECIQAGAPRKEVEI